MRLFRGITVPASKAELVLSVIRTRGLSVGQGERWEMDFRHPGPLNILLEKSDLSLADSRPLGAVGDPGVCACGDVTGAYFYASRHNITEHDTTPILIEFEVAPESVSVDGRDFLYTVFQMGDPDRARSVLENAFGPDILPYADRAWSCADQGVALCDLARYDPGVVAAHHSNQTVLGGRHGTTFKSAFIVKLPVAAGSVLRAWVPNDRLDIPEPQIAVYDLLRSARGPYRLSVPSDS